MARRSLKIIVGKSVNLGLLTKHGSSTYFEGKTRVYWIRAPVFKSLFYHLFT